MQTSTDQLILSRKYQFFIEHTLLQITTQQVQQMLCNQLQFIRITFLLEFWLGKIAVRQSEHCFRNNTN